MLDLWYKALSSPVGVEIQCSDAEKIRQRLYAARAKVQDEDLSGLAVCVSPFDTTKLWIIKKKISKDLIPVESLNET